MGSKRNQLLRAGVDVRAEHVEFMHDAAEGTGRDVGDIVGMAIQIGCEVLMQHASLGLDPCHATRVTLSYGEA